MDATGNGDKSDGDAGAFSPLTDIATRRFLQMAIRRGGGGVWGVKS